MARRRRLRRRRRGPQRMSTARGSRREGRRCVRARRRRSMTTQGETKDGSEDASRAKRLGVWLTMGLCAGLEKGGRARPMGDDGLTMVCCAMEKCGSLGCGLRTAKQGGDGGSNQWVCAWCACLVVGLLWLLMRPGEGDGSPGCWGGAPVVVLGDRRREGCARGKGGMGCDHGERLGA